MYIYICIYIYIYTHTHIYRRVFAPLRGQENGRHQNRGVNNGVKHARSRNRIEKPIPRTLNALCKISNLLHPLAHAAMAAWCKCVFPARMRVKTRVQASRVANNGAKICRTPALVIASREKTPAFDEARLAVIKSRAKIYTPATSDTPARFVLWTYFRH